VPSKKKKKKKKEKKILPFGRLRKILINISG